METAAFNGHTTQVTAMGLFPIAGAMERYTFQA
jgi:hypothetical protein